MVKSWDLRLHQISMFACWGCWFNKYIFFFFLYLPWCLGASLIAQLVKNRLQCRRPRFDSCSVKSHWRRDRLPTPVFLAFPCGSAGKESACSAGDLGMIPGWGRSTREMDRLRTPVFLDFLGGSAGKESACNAGDLGSILGLGRFPWRRERLPTPVFWPGEFHGLYSSWGCKESDTTEQLSPCRHLAQHQHTDHRKVRGAERQ